MWTINCVTGVEMFRKLLDQAIAGDNIGILLRGINRDQVERGQVVAIYGYTFRSGECFLGDTAYSLNPENMEARVATTVSSSIIKSNVLQLDDLYRVIAKRAGRTDYTTETRDVEGIACKAEVYPEKGNDAEAVFCFDESGSLVFVVEGAPPVMPSIGETFYTVKKIDADVDESLFDISAYTIISK